MPSKPTIFLRPPTTLSLTSSSTAPFTPPPPDFLLGTWHVTHSTLPMWRSKRNVTITYAPLPSSTSTPAPPKLESTVAYQTLTGSKVKTVVGIETPTHDGSGPPDAAERGGGGGVGEYDWRGKGWLKIASSHWEILGYSHPTSGPLSTGQQQKEAEGQQQNAGGPTETTTTDWAVTYFAKTLFTPAGIDLYCRSKEGVGTDVLEGIKAAFAGMEDEGMRKLGGELFEVRRV